ncbi:MAG: hypothetical protein ABI867_35390 [Kofleriaceae bacterium]
MVRRHVLAALAQGVAAGDEDAARAALTVEWLLRERARRKLESVLLDAALATNELDGMGDRETARHVQRVAALELAGVAVDVLDRAAVWEAYAALPVRQPSRLPVALVCVLAVVVALTAWAVTMRPARRPMRTVEAYVRPLPPPAAGAYQDGGVPLRDLALEQFLADDFTQLVLETDRDHATGKTDPDRKAHALQIEQAPVIAAYGPPLVAVWSDMLAVLDHWVATGDASELRAKVRVVSDQLAAMGVGLYLEGDVGSFGGAAHAVVYAYRVEEVVFVVAGGERRRVLSLRRLDKLNLSHRLLGMQSEELGDPVLLLDQIDEHVASIILPVLAPDAPYPFDDPWTGTDRLAGDAGRAMRRELVAAFGSDADAAVEIATLLRERGALVDDWRGLLERREITLSRLTSLYLPPRLYEELDGEVPAKQLARARAIDDRLLELDAGRIASQGHELVAATVRRHEAQHGLDADRDHPLSYPGPLEDLLGAELNRDGEPRRHVQRGRAELSAYLSQIANDPKTPQLAVWHVARNAFHRKRWGTAESFAGVLIVEGIGRHLGVGPTEPVVHGRRIDRDRLLAPAIAIANASTEQLRAAARELWLELYGEPLVPITDK